MYAQVTFLQVPIGQTPLLRDLIETRYLPIVRQRPGFKAGYLLEQIDDAETAQLVLFWDCHASVESFNRTGMLQASLHALTAFTAAFARRPGAQRTAYRFDRPA